jgi:predicted RNA-binding Zn-ribbon protein involved in translation (DUF1610 family)
LWQSEGLENGRLAGHIRGMARGIWTTEYFSCPDCGMNYSATKEQHPDKHSGSFDCKVCGAEVHAWSGVYDFFGWKIDQMGSPVFGKKK